MGVLIRSASALAVIVMMAMPSAVAADPAGKKRCDDLVAFFDRWGATRTAHSDGSRNHVRIGARLDCKRGGYEKGIAEMEALLHDKGFEVPVDVGEAPMYFPDESRSQAQVRESR